MRSFSKQSATSGDALIVSFVAVEMRFRSCKISYSLPGLKYSLCPLTSSVMTVNPGPSLWGWWKGTNWPTRWASSYFQGYLLRGPLADLEESKLEGSRLWLSAIPRYWPHRRNTLSISFPRTGKEYLLMGIKADSECRARALEPLSV